MAHSLGALRVGLMSAAVLLGGCVASVTVQNERAPESEVRTYPDRVTPADVFAAARDHSRPALREFLEDFPKGGDLHSHLAGAFYVETVLDWAIEDGHCVDTEIWAIVYGPETGDCASKTIVNAEGETVKVPGRFVEASVAAASEPMNRQLVNARSMRSFVPYNGWSGHDQFFSIFGGLARSEARTGDALAAVANRAGRQNVQYLELMETIVLGALIPLGDEVTLTGEPAADYKALMASSFGQQFEGYLAQIEATLETAYARKDEVMGCASTAPQPGCNVEINMIHQVVREFKPATVYAQIILGWEVMKRFDRVVALNLVAPEDGFYALRDYRQHMEMIDYLYRLQGARNVTLHAGELTLGLVRPDQLGFHIHDAIHVGHATRIGHGIDIAYEEGHEALLQKMAEEGIMVEINLTSNDVILDVKGYDHPLKLYRSYGVPFALSTDDEGVSRIDLTHEYVTAVLDQGLGYADLITSSRNALTYSFMTGDSLWDNKACVVDVEKRRQTASDDCAGFLQGSVKASQQWALEQRRFVFEDSLKLP